MGSEPLNAWFSPFFGISVRGLDWFQKSFPSSFSNVLLLLSGMFSKFLRFPALNLGGLIVCLFHGFYAMRSASFVSSIVSYELKFRGGNSCFIMCQCQRLISALLSGWQ
jgi:hypothetical protein